MQICLISSDDKLQTLVAQVAGPKFCITPPDVKPPESEYYLWDVGEGFILKPLARGRHLFLVDRRHLAGLAEQLGDQSVGIILKPITRGTLEAFLGDAGIETLRSDRDALLQHVLRANLKLQEYDQDRTNFLARVLHDLRAPLTALQGYCGLLLDGELGAVNSQQAEVLQRMRNSTQRMALLVNSMFELSVAGRVERKLNLEEGDIEGCVNQALHDVAAYLREKEISVDTQLDPPEQGILIDTKQIEQLLVNLLENACKFTPRRGSIEIRGYSVPWDPPASDADQSTLIPNAYRLEIHDSGPGIDASALHSIFEEYTSCTGANDRSSGLGLAICKLIVNSHGGKIWAESTKGAAFFVILPFEPRRTLERVGAKREVDRFVGVVAG